MIRSSYLPLSQSFLGRLSELRHLSHPLFRGFHPLKALAGPPSEFDGHRPYLPGDDTRWIDWNLFARLEELHVKVFQVEEEVEIVLMVDGSLSMTSGSGAKYQLAAYSASALAYLGLLTSHPVTIAKYAEAALGAEGPYRHIRLFPFISEYLLAAPKGRGTDLRRGLSPFLHSRIRPATFVALTDGLQRDSLESIAALVKETGRHRLLLMLIEDPADRRPPLQGNLLLKDLEGTISCRFLADPSLKRQMHRRIDDYFSRLERGVGTLGAQILRMSVKEPFEESFLKLLVESNQARVPKV